MDTDRDAADEGALAAQLEHVKAAIPNLLAIKRRVDGGDTLGDTEIADLDDRFQRARHMLHTYDEHPAVQELLAKLASLYEQITSKALENECAGGDGPDPDAGE